MKNLTIDGGTAGITINATMLPLGITLEALNTELHPETPGGQDGLRVLDMASTVEPPNLTVTLPGLFITGGRNHARFGVPWMSAA